MTALLGAWTPVKSLYVERFCLTLEYWLRGWYEMTDGGVIGLRAAIAAIEQEIRRHGQADEALLQAMHPDTGALFPCLHKLFRRFDIILSSIGGGRWRAGMPENGGSRAERLATSERFLAPMAAWLEHAPPYDDFAATLHHDLGAHTPTKNFLVALLISLLRSQLTGDQYRNAVVT